jgi:hypothetical protein
MATTTLSNAFISLNDIINNFLISYTGPGKLIPDAVRTEVIFHARRCLQEFAYETIKSQFVYDAGSIPISGLPYTDTLPADFVAVIEVTAAGAASNPLVEVSTAPPLSGEFFINYTTTPKQIIYGSGGAVLVTYLSNALTTDESAAIPKLAEQALYSCMIYAILANRENTRPDVLQRLLIDKTDKLERAKSRLVFTNFD